MYNSQWILSFAYMIGGLHKEREGKKTLVTLTWTDMLGCLQGNIKMHQWPNHISILTTFRVRQNICTIVSFDDLFHCKNMWAGNGLSWDDFGWCALELAIYYSRYPQLKGLKYFTCHTLIDPLSHKPWHIVISLWQKCIFCQHQYTWRLFPTSKNQNQAMLRVVKMLS